MKTKQVKVLVGLFLVVLTAWALNSCSKSDTAPPDKTSLKAAIASAQNLLTTTVEGTAAGQYIRGSQATLQASLTAAQAVVDNTASTKDQITAATAQLAAAVTAYQAAAIVPIDPTNLVGQWTFNEITAAAVGATVKDYSGNSHDGTIKKGNDYWGAIPPPGAAGSGGVPALAADRYGDAGKALHFDHGANVEIPYTTALNPPAMTLSLWAKPDVNSPIVNNQYFIAMNRWNGYKFNFQDTPRAFFTATYDDPSVPVTNHCCLDRDQNVGTAPQGAWHHYVVTFGPGHEIFYIDGVLVYDWTNIPTQAKISQLQSPVNLVFGQDLPSTGYSTNSSDPNYLNWGGYYIGTLDEVRLYKSVLSATQVTSIYNQEKP
jgi:hypothetical protein